MIATLRANKRIVTSTAGTGTCQRRKLPLTEAGAVVGFAPHVTSLSDYYPFGSGMEGRTVDGSYRYSFQGQETDAEYFNGAVSFKYRVHDARLGRFLSIDPLAPDYPWNSTYAFSENRVVDGVELEGLEMWSIHGTTTYGPAGQFTDDLQRKLQSTFGSSAVFEFKWSGEDNDRARNHAGTDLAVIDANNIYDTWNGIEQIVLVGHSHGGNVALHAAKALINVYSVPADKITIVAINTPGNEYADLKEKHDAVELLVINGKDDRVQKAGSFWIPFKTSGGAQEPARADHVITYDDQFGEGPCSYSNHCGLEAENVNEWLPVLREKVQLDQNGEE